MWCVPTLPRWELRERTSYDTTSMPGTLGMRTAWQTSRSRLASMRKGPRVTRTTLSFASAGPAMAASATRAMTTRLDGMVTSACRVASAAQPRQELAVFVDAKSPDWGREAGERARDGLLSRTCSGARARLQPPPGPARAFTARAATTARTASEISDWTIISTFIWRDITSVSVGLNAVLLLKAKKR